MKAKQKENVKEWIKELRSGNWTQTTGKLCHKGRYCCLGVACEIKNALIPSNIAADVKGMYNLDGSFGSGLPSYDWFLENYGMSLYKKFDCIDQGKKERLSLAELNDFAGYNFKQIADVLEDHLNQQKGKNVNHACI